MVPRMHVLVCLLFIGLSAACGQATQYGPVDPPGQLGPLAVGYEAFTSVDSDRADRSLPVEVWYPVDPGDAQGLPAVTYPLAPLIGLESEVAVAGAPVSARWDPGPCWSSPTATAASATSPST